MVSMTEATLTLPRVVGVAKSLSQNNRVIYLWRVDSKVGKDIIKHSLLCLKVCHNILIMWRLELESDCFYVHYVIGNQNFSFL